MFPDHPEFPNPGSPEKSPSDEPENGWDIEFDEPDGPAPIDPAPRAASSPLLPPGRETQPPGRKQRLSFRRDLQDAPSPTPEIRVQPAENDDFANPHFEQNPSAHLDASESAGKAAGTPGENTSPPPASHLRSFAADPVPYRHPQAEIPQAEAIKRIPLQRKTGNGTLPFTRFVTRPEVSTASETAAGETSTERSVPLQQIGEGRIGFGKIKNSGEAPNYQPSRFQNVIDETYAHNQSRRKNSSSGRGVFVAVVLILLAGIAVFTWLYYHKYFEKPAMVNEPAAKVSSLWNSAVTLPDAAAVKEKKFA